MRQKWKFLATVSWLDFASYPYFVTFMKKALYQIILAGKALDWVHTHTYFEVAVFTMYPAKYFWPTFFHLLVMMEKLLLLLTTSKRRNDPSFNKTCTISAKAKAEIQN